MADFTYDVPEKKAAQTGWSLRSFHAEKSVGGWFVTVIVDSIPAGETKVLRFEGDRIVINDEEQTLFTPNAVAKIKTAMSDYGPMVGVMKAVQSALSWAGTVSP